MLEVKSISKTYITGGLKQIALDKVSLCFRDSEFVSILGPSGSGKTTLLNIIGGLDKYDSGDLIINKVSTKKYKSRDWDSYRNHSVGFVFQSYNLIPHQTILSNVELALTISGVSKRERRKRALKALDQVGLKDQAHKRPNQMSGGQMQRVAVARALVNNPDILLADEPTGALDSETSLQVMDLLKKIGKDRLVIMVTHNPELAEEYSTRIVKLKDGKVIDDSNPFEIEEKTKIIQYKNLGKASMSIPTAYGLSLNNLLTKKGRTIITSFAGSIGIIGIALILALSTGFQNYIDQVQEDMLTSYPLEIERETANTTSMFASAMTQEEDKTKDEKKDVIESKSLEKMFTSVGKNDIKSFNNYLKEHKDEVDKMTTHISYKYGVEPQIYARDTTKKIIQVNPSDYMATLMGGATGMSNFAEISGNTKMFKDQYDVIKGRLPERYDELMIILPEEGHISDVLLYSLGLKDSSKIEEMLKKLMAGEKVQDDGIKLEFSYDDLMNVELKLIHKADTYRYNSQFNIYESMASDTNYMENLYSNAESLKIVGIVKPKNSDNMTAIMSGVGYINELPKHVVEVAQGKEIVKKQLMNKKINVINGKSFDDTSEDSGVNFENMISIDTDMLSSAFGINIDEEELTNITTSYIESISNDINADTESAKNKFISNLSTITKDMLNTYITENHLEGMETVASIPVGDADSIVENYISRDAVQIKLNALEQEYTIPAVVYNEIYTTFIKAFLNGYVTIASGGGETAMIATSAVDTIVDAALDNDETNEMANAFARQMVEATMQKNILPKIGELSGKLIAEVAGAFNVDQDKIANAFKFNLSEDDIKRLFNANTAASKVLDANVNLTMFGYADYDEPATIEFFFKDFASKEKFTKFIKKYNKKVKKENKDKVIEYQDITGLMISSVKVIVDSVSYVLIAFVSISLIVSSIMIGIITYISVLERTKEIGILRALGARRKDITRVFNAETFIIGLASGLIGIIIAVLLTIPINIVLYDLTELSNVARLDPLHAFILIVVSMTLTMIGGLIPAHIASKKDPVEALRTE